jgi:signal transduction histidine kinase
MGCSSRAGRTSQDTATREIVDCINASVEALERQFTALMDISSWMPVRWFHRAQISAGAFVRALEREFAPLAAARGLRLGIVPTGVWVDSDPVLLERVLANFVSNAVRHTGRGGAVVGVRRRGAQVAIEVRDTGAGIPAAERVRIFEAFYQIRRATPDAGQGMGLGLAIIRRLAALLGHPIDDHAARVRAVVVPRSGAIPWSPGDSRMPVQARWPVR